MMKIFIFSLLFLAALVGLCQGRIKCSKAHPCQHGGRCLPRIRRCVCPSKTYGELCENTGKCYPKCGRGYACIRVGNSTECQEQPCVKVADIAIILDCSGSISKREFKRMLRTVKIFIKHFEMGSDKIQVALFAFNDHISKRRIHLKEKNNEKEFLKELMKFAREHTGGGTRTDKALNYLMSDIFTAANGDRKVAPNIGIIFTDGQSNRPKATKAAALRLKNTDINMICIGIGSRINKKELELIATKEGNVFLTDFKKLPDIVGKLVNKTCDVSKNPCFPNPCEHGGKCRLFLTTYMCDCKTGYIGLKCCKRCDMIGDIVIVLDESGSISLMKFGKMVDAVLQFIMSVDISNKKVRIGVITFSYDVIVHFELDSFHDKLDMLFVCDLLRYKYKGGSTFTSKALKHVKDVSFTPQNGDRRRYPNYVLIFTDGKSLFPWETRNYARELHYTGATVYVVGVGPRVKRSELYVIASQPKMYHTIITSFVRLQLAMKRVMVRICIDLKPRPPCTQCREDCHCHRGMKCCGGCCKTIVDVLS